MASIPTEASPAELAERAALDASSWDEILAHPSCYPELRAWIDSARSGVKSDGAAEPGAADDLKDESAPVAPSLPRSSPFGGSTLGAVLLGVGIGIIVGAVLSSVLIIIVLPGLFGGGLG